MTKLLDRFDAVFGGKWYYPFMVVMTFAAYIVHMIVEVTETDNWLIIAINVVMIPFLLMIAASVCRTLWYWYDDNYDERLRDQA